MAKSLTRRVVILSTILILAGAGVALVAAPRKAMAPHPGAEVNHTPGGPKFSPCPTPACMAPCQEPAQPQVVCRDDASGATAVTSYTCCCCGGGGGNSFSPI